MGSDSGGEDIEEADAQIELRGHCGSGLASTCPHGPKNKRGRFSVRLSRVSSLAILPETFFLKNPLRQLDCAAWYA